MSPACEQIGLERLTAWVDGRLPTQSAVQEMEAHVAVCPECAAHAARLRAYKGRLADFRATTTPRALPAGLWERTAAALDRTASPTHRAPHRQPAAPPRLAPRRGALALALTLAAAIALALAHLYQTRLVLPVHAILAWPIPARVTFVTDDADRAARWLSSQLRTDLPPVSLSLMGARLTGADADRTKRVGLLIYRTASGAPLALYLHLDRRVTLPPLATVRYEGSTYRIAAKETPVTSLAVWQRGGRTFVATGPLPLRELLSHAREMDRHCLPRR